jgi:hypothetical protein
MTPGDARGDYSSIHLSHVDSFLLFGALVAEVPNYCYGSAISTAIVVTIIVAYGLFSLRGVWPSHSTPPNYS